MRVVSYLSSLDDFFIDMSFRILMKAHLGVYFEDSDVNLDFLSPFIYRKDVLWIEVLLFSYCFYLLPSIANFTYCSIWFLVCYNPNQHFVEKLFHWIVFSQLI